MKKGRYIFCVLLLAAIFTVYVCRLGQWQLSDGEEYAQQAVVSSSFVKLTGTRGEILDRNGDVLAGNRSVYNVMYSKLHWDADNRNADLLETVKLLESIGEEWVDRLPILVTPVGGYVFAENSEKEIEFLRSEDFLNVGDTATAAECMEKLVRRYGAQDITDPADVRRVAAVRYNLERSYFSRTCFCFVYDEIATVFQVDTSFIQAVDLSVNTIKFEDVSFAIVIFDRRIAHFVFKKFCNVSFIDNDFVDVFCKSVTDCPFKEFCFLKNKPGGWRRLIVAKHLFPQ